MDNSGKPRKSALPVYAVLLVIMTALVGVLVWAIQRPGRYAAIEAPADTEGEQTVDFGKNSSKSHKTSATAGVAPDNQFAGVVRSSSQSEDNPKDLGEALMENGDFRKAAVQFAEALRQNPEDNDALKKLAQCLAKSGQVFDAAEKFNELLAKTPNDAEVHQQFGDALQKLGKTNEARLQYDLALRLNPDLLKK